MASTDKHLDESHADGLNPSGDMSPRRLISWPEVKKNIVAGRSYHSVLRDEKRGDFPRRVRLGGRQIAWFSDELETWLQNLKKHRGTRPSESDGD